MTNALQTIRQLVADFDAQKKAFLAQTYQESQVRQDFIDKFFAALGWDVTHIQQRNPYEQEVHIENKVSMAGSPKGAGQRRADYAFFLAPNFRDTKFFVEAKKPHGGIATQDNYYQTIRYGWNANTPLAILTDFEEFHVLDCRYKPDIKEALSHKVESFHYSEYVNEAKFSRIYWLFSREAVAGGSIEKRASELSKPRGGGPRGKASHRGMYKGGYQSVDEAFLVELDSYRETLAKAFKKENPTLGSEELTEAVQRTIDRLVFIRFLEDKQIEEPAIINFRTRPSAWKAFTTLCKRLEPKYNGLIFKPHKILDGKEFQPPDDTDFTNICDELADPSSPYNFDQIPISILGSIYERFLGKVVHATDKRVRVEEKPEVRKAGGVYYTPQYIVRYIVNETVGKLLYGTPTGSTKNVEPTPPSKGGEISSPHSRGEVSQRDGGVETHWKTPKEIAAMTFADIACGSGSFLIEVYAQLLEYHLRYYAANPEKRTETDVFERDGKLHLTLKKKKEILTNNVYGVDIDFQATEVTQLSLYLKLLEDVTMHDAHQFGMFKETILPDLRSNIVCGNSLIGTDIKGLGMSSDLDHLKPMDFENVFPEIFKKGSPSTSSGQGFDAVVGNPPYVRQELVGEAKDYFEATYQVAHGAADLYAYFIERGIMKTKDQGLFGYIVANKWLKASYGKPLRLFLKKFRISKLIDFGDLQVFKNATTYPCILIVKKQVPADSIDVLSISSLDFSSLEEIESKQKYVLSTTDLDDSGWNLSSSSHTSLLRTLKMGSASLQEYVGKDICRGVLSGCDDAFVIDEKTKKEILKKSPKDDELIKPYLMGRDVQRYSKPPKQRFLIFTRRGVDIDSYPAIKKHLESFKTRLEPKPKNHRGNWKGRKSGRYEWYEIQDSIEYYRELERPKIIYLKFQVKPAFTLDNEGFYPNSAVWAIPRGDKYLLGILNSKIGWFLISQHCTQIQGGFQLIWEYLKEIPIKKLDLSISKDKARHDLIVSLVEQMLEAKEKLQHAKTDGETSRLELQCKSLDRQIDEAVYELYGLTEEEIKVVEGK